MTRHLVPLSTQEHGRLRFTPTADFSFARDQRTCPVLLTELEHAALSFPLVFPAVDKQVAPVLPQAVFSLLKDNANPWVDSDGNWTAGYLPLHLKKHPFYLGRTKADDAQSVLMIDPDCQSLSTAKGKLLYNKKGEALSPSPLLKQIKQELASLDAQSQYSAALCAELRTCLVPAKLAIKSNDGATRSAIRGFSVVSWDKVKEQDDATLARWARSGLLQVIQLHLLSLKRFGLKA